MNLRIIDGLRRRLARMSTAPYLSLALLICPVAAHAQTGSPSAPEAGVPGLPPIQSQGHVTTNGARIWYGNIGAGQPVLLLHGGMASSRSWHGQVVHLVEAGYRVILIDSRGHGRSNLGDRPLSYELLAEDVLAVMDHLGLRKAAIVGWSDGGIVALVLAMRASERLSGVYAFGANMDRRGVRPNASEAPVLKQVAPRLAADHAALSPDPGGFDALRKAVRTMQETQPDYDAALLRAIRGPAITIAGAEHDEFIKPEHPAYLARVIPRARLEMFADTGHFAPWERPEAFNRSLTAFLARLARRSAWNQREAGQCRWRTVGPGPRFQPLWHCKDGTTSRHEATPAIGICRASGWAASSCDLPALHAPKGPQCQAIPR